MDNKSLLDFSKDSTEIREVVVGCMDILSDEL